MARSSTNVPSRCLLAVPALALAAMTLSPLVGCESAGDRRYRQIRGNLTPELRTLHERKVDQQNAIALTFDENGRMFNEDWGRFWMTDHPSRLSPEPIPH
jgi:hypothetical protein